MVLSILTGAEVMERFTVVGKFAKKLGNRILKENSMDNNFDLNVAHIPKELKLMLEIIKMRR